MNKPDFTLNWYPLGTGGFHAPSLHQENGRSLHWNVTPGGRNWHVTDSSKTLLEFADVLDDLTFDDYAAAQAFCQELETKSLTALSLRPRFDLAWSPTGGNYLSSLSHLYRAGEPLEWRICRQDEMTWSVDPSDQDLLNTASASGTIPHFTSPEEAKEFCQSAETRSCKAAFLKWGVKVSARPVVSEIDPAEFEQLAVHLIGLMNNPGLTVDLWNRINDELPDGVVIGPATGVVELAAVLRKAKDAEVAEYSEEVSNVS